MKKIIKFITDDVWHRTEYNTRFMRIASRQIKVFVFTARSYGQDQLVIRSAALTFYTLMALVPLAAIVFGIAKGFMFETNINDYLYTSFPQHHDLITQIITFANAMLERTKGGAMATIGFVILMWAVIKVFINIESSFNHIWEVRKSRKITRKVSDYLSVLLVAPIFWLVSNNASDLIGNSVRSFAEGTLFSPVIDLMGYTLPFLVVWIMFSVIYFVMPNTKVNWAAAFIAGIIAGTAFHVFQVLYFSFQTTLSNYNAVYGSFAALPLFLIWMNISWQIIMFGAELSFGYQNIEKYEFEREVFNVSIDYRRRATVLVMYCIANNFKNGKKPYDSDKLAAVLNIPVRLIRDVLFDLERANMIVAVDDDSMTYMPAKDPSAMRVLDVLKAVDASGSSRFSEGESEDMRKVTAIMGNIYRKVSTSSENVLLMEIENESGNIG